MITNMLSTIRKTQRKAIEAMYEDTCTIYSKKPVTDPETNITENKDIIIAENEPCRLSYRTMPSTSDAMKYSEYADYVNQVITLFLRPEIEVPAGSLIVVTKFGNVDDYPHETTVAYRNSAERKVHPSHQEMIVMLADKYGTKFD